MPNGWANVTLAELFEFKYGKGLPHELRKKGQINVYGSNGVVGQHDIPVTQGPTIIIGRKGSVGEIHLCQKPCWPIDTTYYIDHFPAELPYQYWALSLKSLRLGKQEKSSAIPGISRDDIYKVEVSLPPLDEQRRILEKLETLLGKVDACQQRLAKIPVILKRFRQAVVDAATVGKLTADWRTKSGSDVYAKADLKRLLAESQALRPRQKEAEPTEGHETLCGAVPDEWEISSLDDLFRFIDYRGKTPVKAEAGKRLISAKNIKRGFLSEDPVEYVSEETYLTWMTRGFPKKGDIFFVTEGHTMGFAAINSREDEFVLAQRTITFQPWRPIETRCFFIFIMSSLFQNLVEVNATGSAAVGIKAAKLRSLPIPFPSILEQHEIVRRVESLLNLADQLEARYTKAKVHFDRLTTSILAKAFRGELVPQDANDEPASELLERIRAQRLQANSMKRMSATSPVTRNKLSKRLTQTTHATLVTEAPAKHNGNISQSILAHMKQGVEYARKDIADTLNISTTDWYLAIRQLKEDNKIVQIGEKRGSKYQLL